MSRKRLKTKMLDAAASGRIIFHLRIAMPQRQAPVRLGIANG
jgi:hypothetical protein